MRYIQITVNIYDGTFCKNSYLGHFLSLPPPKKILIFREMELSSYNVKKFLIFSQKKVVIFQEMETSKKFFIFQETELSHISAENFQARKMKRKPLLKCFLYFGKWNFLAPGLKNLCFWREHQKSENKLFFRTTNLLRYPLLLSNSFFSYRALNNAPHHRYLREFWMCFTS